MNWQTCVQVGALVLAVAMFIWMQVDNNWIAYWILRATHAVLWIGAILDFGTAVSTISLVYLVGVWIATRGKGREA